ncbi:hypothetical protein GCM10027169_31430 [Gordonia jinhuaensis]|uniref:TY-Chap C-terminal domain-containing protein n=1 Tax=Gordonia jinhuaensis TaxID=1517702 RepID=A0A916T7H3_9ACTN|nr:hypothetical protein [Gordonia jinhuaensis]GGB33639.1 hypothetical protein GCM10011489_22230 [Gordonia jinhuaensis]
MAVSDTTALRVELERLLTLDSDQIDLVCAGDALDDLIEFGHDEHAELCERADADFARGDTDAAQYHEQEAAAWRHTLRILVGLRAARRTAGATGRSRRFGAA